MTERLSDSEFKEFWAGHHFDDDCPRPSRWKPWKPFVLPHEPFDFVSHLKRLTQEEAEARQVLEGFLAGASQNNTYVKRVFNRGETFDISRFPKGTILRFSQDSASRSANFREDDVLWGVVGEEQTVLGEISDCVYRFRQTPFSKRLSGGVGFHRNVVVGNVVHSKFSDRHVLGLIPEKFDMLLRINWIEILEYGHGLRKRGSSENEVGRPLFNRTSI